MNLTYNGFAIHNLGEITIPSQTRDYEDGQRCKVTIKVGLTLFERSYAANYALVQQLAAAVRTQNAVLQWTNPDTSTDYLNQTVTLQSSDIPDEWGQYQMQFNLVFFYYETNLVTNNLPLTFAPTGGTAITLG